MNLALSLLVSFIKDIRLKNLFKTFSFIEKNLTDFMFIFNQFPTKSTRAQVYRKSNQHMKEIF